ncbi:hypothetical protein GWI33_010509 [Rhynchophorus ferrugineus]|uniref:Uncharacterized protein n=1 Tax=Rhynchophorus ferrugineus TaxID=354439 RepID=A0A834MND6_RHYFE|nr:hypothetical protein GWI33_010509 [Rhynchophorus ferrugineus]
METSLTILIFHQMHESPRAAAFPVLPRRRLDELLTLREVAGWEVALHDNEKPRTDLFFSPESCDLLWYEVRQSSK